MMEAVRTSETSVSFNMTTWRYIPEDSKLHTRRRVDLKSHIEILVLCRNAYELEIQTVRNRELKKGNFPFIIYFFIYL
jgi:hypothetical protein